MKSITSQIRSLEKSIDKVKGMLKKEGLSEKRIDRLNSQNEESRERIENLNESIQDIGKLEADKNVYAFSQKDGGKHFVRRGEDGKVYIETSSDAISIHEIGHVRQSLDAGGLQFHPASNKLMNVGKTRKTFSENEIEAYRMQYSLDRSFPGSARSLKEINAETVGNIRDESGGYVYPDIRNYAIREKQRLKNKKK